MPTPRMVSTTGAALSSDEEAFAQRVAASFALDMGRGGIKVVRQTDPATGAVVEYHTATDIAYVTPGGAFFVFDASGFRYKYDAVKDKILIDTPSISGGVGYQVEVNTEMWYDDLGQTVVDNAVAYVFDPQLVTIIGVSVYKGVIYCVYSDAMDGFPENIVYPVSENGFSFNSGRKLSFSKLLRDVDGVWGLAETKEYVAPTKTPTFLPAITYYNDALYWASSISFTTNGRLGAALFSSGAFVGTDTTWPDLDNPAIVDPTEMVPASRWVEEDRYLLRVDCDSFDITFEVVSAVATQAIDQTGINTQDGIYHRGNSRQHFSFIQGIVVFTAP